MTEYLDKEELIKWLDKNYDESFELMETAREDEQVYFQRIMEGRVVMIRDIKDYILGRKSISYSHKPSESATIIQSTDLEELRKENQKLALQVRMLEQVKPIRKIPESIDVVFNENEKRFETNMRLVIDTEKKYGARVLNAEEVVDLLNTFNEENKLMEKALDNINEELARYRNEWVYL